MHRRASWAASLPATFTDLFPDVEVDGDNDGFERAAVVCSGTRTGSFAPSLVTGDTSWCADWARRHSPNMEQLLAILSTFPTSTRCCLHRVDLGDDHLELFDQHRRPVYRDTRKGYRTVGSAGVSTHRLINVAGHNRATPARTIDPESCYETTPTRWPRPDLGCWTSRAARRRGPAIPRTAWCSMHHDLLLTGKRALP